MNSKPILTTMTALALSLGAAQLNAAVSADEAAKLGAELTPVGAERAGNAAGTIPEWTGGMTTPPAGFQAGSTRIDPFADEKPLFTIDASNYSEYADKLTEGQKALFKKYPDTFKMPVYKTHRTGAAPQWVYDNTLKNAGTAELAEGGNGVTQAHGGYPFPIPQNGLEAIWNHNLRWLGEGANKNYVAITVYKNGETGTAGGEVWETYPFYQKGNYDLSYDGNLLNLMLQYNQPVRRKGEVLLVKDPVNQADTPRQAWQYIPGQRRVRRAPTVAFDTPNPGTSGQSTYDDSFMYNGSPERYDWKLLGKKEFYVPYNSNKFLNAALEGEEKRSELVTPFHPNPEFERWELHRVWVVEASLKEGKRHVYGKRTFYIDEDTWAAVATDIYDGRGEIWRAAFPHLLNAYDGPVSLVRGYWHVDFQNGNYVINEIDVKPIQLSEGQADKFYTPAQIRKLSRR